MCQVLNTFPCQKSTWHVSQAVERVITSSPPGHPSLSTHPSQSPTWHQAGVQGNITLNYQSVTGLGSEGVCAHNTLFCVSLSSIVLAVALQWHKRAAAGRGSVNVEARKSQACTPPCRALQSHARCASELPQHTFPRRSLGPRHHTAWGGAGGALSVLSLWVWRMIIFWVRAHGAAPAGVGEATLRGHTWTWPFYLPALGYKAYLCGTLSSCVMLRLSVPGGVTHALVVSESRQFLGGWHNNLFMLKRLVGEWHEAVGNVVAKQWFGFCGSLKVRCPGSHWAVSDVLGRACV